MYSSARRTVLLGAGFVQTYAEFGVRSPSRLVARRTHVPGSGSCGGAGAAVQRALPTLVHPRIHPYHVLPRTPRPSLARQAPVAAFAIVHQSRAITARTIILPTAPPIFHHPPHSCGYACPPKSRSLPLEALPPISYLPSPAAFASTTNPACLRGARSRVPPSIRLPRSILKSSASRCRGEARPQGEEGGAILARVGLDFITARAPLNPPRPPRMRMRANVFIPRRRLLAR
ncbi:hypothetical protein B0H13DRAFT_1972680, partial [Mycena leptocephala]